MKAVGARLPRYDGIAHVTGRTQYVDDLRIHGSLVVKAFRSPVHRANIRSLDTSKAEAMKGVKAVVTWKDVPVLEYGHLSGLGIPAEVLPKLFDRFYRGEADTASGARGLGLGLYITKSLVEAHGGRVWAVSEGPGRGSTFSFALPYGSDEADA